MASLVFIIDIEEGHLLPSFWLAQALRSAGHDITYVSVPDNEPYINQQGFRFYAIFEKSFPRGTNLKIKERLRLEGYSKTDAPLNSYFEELVKFDFRVILRDLKPDLIIMSWMLCLEALILYYTLRVSPVIFTPCLRPVKRDIIADCHDTLMAVSGDRAARLIDTIINFGYKFKSLTDFSKPLASFDEIVHCPSELEMETIEVRKNVYHLGPGIFKRTDTDGAGWDMKVCKGNRIVYASLGTQSIIYGRTRDRCFEVFLRMMGMREMAGWHLILATCCEQDGIDRSKIPENVSVVKWAPQTEVLESAEVAIIHGGLGTIKECIYYGVPMIVLPLARDQPLNARRVAYHRLGIVHEPELVLAEQLAASILAIANSDEIRSALRRMQKLFHEKDESNSIVKVIGEILYNRKIKSPSPL